MHTALTLHQQSWIRRCLQQGQAVTQAEDACKMHGFQSEPDPLSTVLSPTPTIQVTLEGRPPTLTLSELSHMALTDLAKLYSVNLTASLPLECTLTVYSSALSHVVSCSSPDLHQCLQPCTHDLSPAGKQGSLRASAFSCLSALAGPAPPDLPTL